MHFRSGRNEKDISWTVKLVKILNSFHAFPYISKRNRNLPFEMHNIFLKGIRLYFFVGFILCLYFSFQKDGNLISPRRW